MEVKKVATTAERLQQLISKRGIKQADILEMAQPYCVRFSTSLARNALSQYVTGKVVPKQDKLLVLGHALGVSEVWLMGFDVPMEREPVKDSRCELISRIFESLSESGKQMLLAQARLLQDMEQTSKKESESVG